MYEVILKSSDSPTFLLKKVLSDFEISYELEVGVEILRKISYCLLLGRAFEREPGRRTAVAMSWMIASLPLQIYSNLLKSFLRQCGLHFPSLVCAIHSFSPPKLHEVKEGVRGEERGEVRVRRGGRTVLF